MSFTVDAQVMPPTSKTKVVPMIYITADPLSPGEKESDGDSKREREIEREKER